MRTPARDRNIPGVSMSGSEMWLIVLIGAIGALVVAGPLLRPGVILDLDFVLLPDAPLPNGFWGLGPELPRRTPVMLPITWLGPLIGSVAAGKLMVLVALCAAFVGATRLAGEVPLPWRLAAGAIYAFGPFATTRLAVGHLFVLAAMAVLPFALPTLLRPTRDPHRTFLWALALGLTGSLGGLFALACVGAGALGAGWRGARAFAAAVAAQTPWVVPGSVVMLQGVDLAPAAAFRPDVDAPHVLTIASGHGFWQRTYQVGWSTPGVAVVAAVVLVALAVAGRAVVRSDLPRLDLIAAAVLAFVLLSASTRTAWVTDALLGGPGAVVAREPQRLLPLFLVWASPAAVVGAATLAGRWHGVSGDLVRPGAAVVALVLAAPGLWGAGGRIDPVELPSEWTTVRELVRAEPGTVLALPWSMYLDLDAAGGRRVLHPLPLLLGGDVVASSDPRLPGIDARERSDPREPWAALAVAANLGGEPVGEDLAALGIRWIVVLEGGGLVRGREVGSLHTEALSEDPGLRHRLDGRTIDLFEVAGWPGQLSVWGSPTGPRPLLGPFGRLDRSGPGVLARPHADGWLRGLEPIGPTDRGLLAIPAGTGWIWYWPSVLVLTSYIAVFVAAIYSISRKGDEVIAPMSSVAAPAFDG